MDKSASSQPDKARSQKNVDPRVAVVLLAAAIALILYLGYRWMQPTGVPTSAYINAARYWIEKPERDKMEAQHMPKSQIDSKIQEMWDKGTLKLPSGEPGKDWVGTPNGITVLSNGPGAPASAPAPGSPGH